MARTTDPFGAQLAQELASSSDQGPVGVLLADYARYHLALVVVGGFFLIGFIVLSVVFVRRWLKAPRVEQRRLWSFEKTVYAGFAALSIVMALFLALVVAANASNVRDPRTGLQGTVAELNDGSPHLRELHRSAAAWLESDDVTEPAPIQTAVSERLAWQRPKALICWLLLAGFLVAAALMWRTLLRRCRTGDSWRGADWLLLLGGSATVALSLLLMLMVMGNTQAAVAPLMLTLLYG